MKDDVCKYLLPCGFCDRTKLNKKCSQKQEESEIGIISSEMYDNAIWQLRGYLEDIKRSPLRADVDKEKDGIIFAIEALKRERDRYFPGKWTKKFKVGSCEPPTKDEPIC